MLTSHPLGRTAYLDADLRERERIPLATAAAMLGRAPAGGGAGEPTPGGEALVATAPWLMIDGAGG